MAPHQWPSRLGSKLPHFRLTCTLYNTDDVVRRYQQPLGIGRNFGVKSSPTIRPGVSFHLNAPEHIRHAVAEWNACDGDLGGGMGGDASALPWSDYTCAAIGCGKYCEDFLACARCKSWRPTRYCSTAHQKADWKTHKHRCFKKNSLTHGDDEVGDGGAASAAGTAGAAGEEHEDKDITIAALPHEILERIFAAAVDADTVSTLPTLMLVCKGWRAVASKPALWRFVRFAGGSSIQSCGGVKGATQPPMQTVFRELARGTRSEHLRKIDFSFMHGVDGAPRTPNGEAVPRSPYRHIDETCLMLMLGTLNLPKLNAVVFCGMASGGTETLGGYPQRTYVTEANFFPYRRFLVQYGGTRFCFMYIF